MKEAVWRRQRTSIHCAVCSVQKKQSSVQCRESSIIHSSEYGGLVPDSPCENTHAVHQRPSTDMEDEQPVTVSLSSHHLLIIISLESLHWGFDVRWFHDTSSWERCIEQWSWAVFFEALPAQWAGWALGQCQLGSCRFGTLALLAPPRLLSSRHWPTDPPPGDLSLLPSHFTLLEFRLKLKSLWVICELSGLAKLPSLHLCKARAVILRWHFVATWIGVSWQRRPVGKWSFSFPVQASVQNGSEGDTCFYVQWLYNYTYAPQNIENISSPFWVWIHKILEF